MTMDRTTWEAVHALAEPFLVISADRNDRRLTVEGVDGAAFDVANVLFLRGASTFEVDDGVIYAWWD